MIQVETQIKKIKKLSENNPEDLGGGEITFKELRTEAYKIMADKLRAKRPRKKIRNEILEAKASGKAEVSRSSWVGHTTPYVLSDTIHL